MFPIAFSSVILSKKESSGILTENTQSGSLKCSTDLIILVCFVMQCYLQCARQCPETETADLSQSCLMADTEHR